MTINPPKLLVLAPPEHPVLRLLDDLRGSCQVTISNNQDELHGVVDSAEVILATGISSDAINFEPLFRKAQRLRWIHSLTAGVEKLLFPALIHSDVPLTNARGVFKRSLAEFAVLGILYHTKKVRRLIENQQQQKWDTFDVDWANGLIMGVVGFGEIGRECALLAKGLGLKIHALQRTRAVSDDLADRVFDSSQLDDMLASIDVLLCAAPLTPATRHMISDAQLAKLKPSSIVINVGRGPVIDEAALVRALEQGKIAAASLDVFEHEPLSRASPLWEMKNVLLSPHCTDHTQKPDWMDLSMKLFLENFARYRAGSPLKNVVNKTAGY